ncbi:MAG: hypothetical protein ACTSW1_08530 [Candidatus Hodarchaeales archaeon]
MDKFCIFCGHKPESKNFEHIIPQWLINLTGNPKRIAYFGYQLDVGTEPKHRSFSFNAFKFPSCETCNNTYSELETRSKSIIEKILNCNPISAIDVHVLLDWFDKVRVGLWLGYQYLDRNPAGITPKFYIQDRIAMNDRMIAIFKADTADTDVKGLTFFGCDFPSFTYTPSCFSLRINNFFFLNMSYNDLFSRRIGFPYPREVYQLPDRRLMGTYTAGRNRVMIPLLKKRFSIKGTELYQPIFRGRIDIDSDSRKLYDTQYVHDNSMVWEAGIGKVFRVAKDALEEYPDTDSILYLPNVSYEFPNLVARLVFETLDWQEYIDNIAPSLEKLPVKTRAAWRKQVAGVKRNNAMLRKLLMRKYGVQQRVK